jgi:FMN phosphatase YigB (HAD superfamily)
MDPLGAAPGRTLMVGDSLRRDREGARRLGLDFVWIAPGDLHGGADGHAAIASLDGLMELVS